MKRLKNEDEGGGVRDKGRDGGWRDKGGGTRGKGQGKKAEEEREGRDWCERRSPQPSADRVDRHSCNIIENSSRRRGEVPGLMFILGPGFGAVGADLDVKMNFRGRRAKLDHGCLLYTGKNAVGPGPRGDSRHTKHDPVARAVPCRDSVRRKTPPRNHRIDPPRLAPPLGGRPLPRRVVFRAGAFAERDLRQLLRHRRVPDAARHVRAQRQPYASSHYAIWNARGATQAILQKILAAMASQGNDLSAGGRPLGQVLARLGLTTPRTPSIGGGPKGIGPASGGCSRPDGPRRPAWPRGCRPRPSPRRRNSGQAAKSVE